MHKTIVLFAAAFMAAPAFASDDGGPAATIKQFVDGFNSGDIESALSTCAAETYIIDEFAPYQWGGEGACETWANDFNADAEARGVTDAVVTLHEAKHVFIEGDNAYVVSPVDYTYKIDGEEQGQTGSMLTSVLQKQDGVWKIIQWSWTQGEPIE